MAKIEAHKNGPALLFLEQRVRQDGEDMEVRARIVPLGAGQHLTRSFHPKLVNDQFHTCIAGPKAILQSRHGTKSSIMSRIQRAYDPYLLRRELPVGEFQSHKVKFQNKDSELWQIYPMFNLWRVKKGDTNLYHLRNDERYLQAIPRPFSSTVYFLGPNGFGKWSLKNLKFVTLKNCPDDLFAINSETLVRLGLKWAFSGDRLYVLSRLNQPWCYDLRNNDWTSLPPLPDLVERDSALDNSELVTCQDRVFCVWNYYLWELVNNHQTWVKTKTFYIRTVLRP